MSQKEKNIHGLRLTRDGGVILHADALQAADSLKQASSADVAMRFGGDYAQAELEFAAEREPIAHFLVYQMAKDALDNWFTVEDPSTESSDPRLDADVQEALNTVGARRVFQQALEYERLYGWSLIVGAFNDAKNEAELKLPLRPEAQLRALAVYSPPNITVVERDLNPVSATFGQPLIYQLNRGNGAQTLIHASRCFKVATRSNEKSVLAPIWDDLVCLRNIRWGAAQWLFRNGGGFPVIEFPAGTTVEQLEQFVSSGAFSNIMNRTYIAIAQNSTAENTGMKFHFEGAAQASLDPTPFFKNEIEQISIATGVPQPKLIGAQAGAVTGSELNQQEYYKVIASTIQSPFEAAVRWVIDRLAEGGAVPSLKISLAEKIRDYIGLGHDYRTRTSTRYVIKWNNPFQLSRVDEARVMALEAQAYTQMLSYMTVNEVRAKLGLEPLPEDKQPAKAEAPAAAEEPEGDSYVITRVKKPHKRS